MRRRNRWIVAASLPVAAAACVGAYFLMQPERCEPDENGNFNCSISTLYAQSQAASDWSVNLPVLLLGIDTCIESYSTDFSRETVAITKAWPASEGLTFLRMRDTYGHGMDCLWRQATNEVMFFTVGSGDFQEIHDEGDPAFIPAWRGSPKGVCDEASEVRDAEGKIAGWVANTRCNFAY